MSADPLASALLNPVSKDVYREDVRHRSTTPSPVNTDDELGSDLPSDASASSSYGKGRSSSAAVSGAGTSRAVGINSSTTQAMGSGGGAVNTGPKGVLRDRNAQQMADRAHRAQQVRLANERLQRLAPKAETYTQQVARERRQAKQQLAAENLSSDEPADDDLTAAISNLQQKEQRKEHRIAALRSGNRLYTKRFSFHSSTSTTTTLSASHALKNNGRWFGHLREVDERGYVSAIDDEDSSVPIVIHIYSKAVSACQILTHSLSNLARTYPKTKFLSVQASAIGFGRGISEQDDDQDDEEEYDEFDSRTTDVLPTLLIYRGGRLVANLVRVDLDERWKTGDERAIRDLLAAYNALILADGCSPLLAKKELDRCSDSDSDKDDGDDDHH